MEKEVTKEDGHYQLPLSFKNRDLHWPNTRMQVMMRLQDLRKRFRKDQTSS